MLGLGAVFHHQRNGLLELQLADFLHPVLNPGRLAAIDRAGVDQLVGATEQGQRRDRQASAPHQTELRLSCHCCSIIERNPSRAVCVARARAVAWSGNAPIRTR